jgi:hypothetical protein
MRLRVFFACLLAVGNIQAQTRFQLSAGDVAAGDNFGTAVSISGDRIVVGASGEGDPKKKGKVYIFERGHTKWNPVATLAAADAKPGDQFGHSVAASEDHIVVGAPGDKERGFAAGSAYIFGRNPESGTGWRQVAKIFAGDAVPGRQFGQSIAISGDLLVVGSQLDDDSARSPGSAYVFERNQGGIDKWGPVGKLTASRGNRSNAFGSAVSVIGDLVVVGAPGDNHAGFASGSAYLFKRNHDGDNMWKEVAKLTAADATAGGAFGNSVSISEDRVVIGAPFDHDAGSAYIFERNPVGHWNQLAKLTAPEAAALQNFGSSVAISGTCVAVGASHDSLAGSNAGSVSVFERLNSPDRWGYVTKLAPLQAAAGDSFGASVSMSGVRVVSGAPFESHAGANTGSAYVEEHISKSHCIGPAAHKQ